MRPEYTGREGPQEIGIHGKRESSEGPEYPEKGGPRRDRNTQGEMALRETVIHRENVPSERQEAGDNNVNDDFALGCSIS